MYVKITTVFIAMKFLFVFTGLSEEPINNYSITVKVENLRNSKGVVQFTLYNKENSIPDEHYKNYFQLKVANIDTNTSETTFKNLPAGIYAINVLHDENSNGKVDKGLFLPKEGIGFSNYSSIGVGNKPRFSKASFVLDKNQTITIKVIYL